MGRVRVLLAIVGSLSLLLAPGVAPGRAQDAPAAAHPLHGTWLMRSIPFPDDPPSIAAFGADGSVVVTSADSVTSRGSWSSTGPSTADITVWYLTTSGMTVLRGAGEVAAGGQAFTLTYTLELIDQVGTGGGEYGPGAAFGERLDAQGPGEPLGSLANLVQQVRGPEFTEVVLVELTEFSITSDTPTLIAGQPYVFVAANLGALVHDFVIEPVGGAEGPLRDGEFEAAVKDIDPGATAELEWTITEPGSYQVACHVPGHYEAGMVFPFEVVAP